MRHLLIVTASLAVGCLPLGGDADRCSLHADLTGGIDGAIEQTDNQCLDAESQGSDGSWFRGAAFDTPDTELWVLLADSLPLVPGDTVIHDVPARLNAYTDDGWYLGIDAGCTAEVTTIQAAPTARGGHFVEGTLVCTEPLDELDTDRVAFLDGVARFTVRIREMD